MRYSKPNKYKAIKHELDGHKFDSKKERDRYAQLKILEKAGEITGLDVHPVFKFVINGKPLKIRSKGFPNGRQAKYTADFGYVDIRLGTYVVEDVKSEATKTEAYALRKALMESLFGIIVKEI